MQRITEKIVNLLPHAEQIRNLTVIAHVDHGKSTLTDSLISAAGLIAKKAAGDVRFMDTRPDEQERTITIKSSAVSLYFPMLAGENGHKETPAEDMKINDEMIAQGKVVPYLVNLIDSPGHVDFSSEVTAALRVTDGALVVVDCVEGVCVQTETVLQQALAERIKPVLFVNKLDRVFFELHADPEDAYQTFLRAIESVNVVIATYREEMFGDEWLVDPCKGTVGFGSGLLSWGFTLESFAAIYAKKFDMSKAQMMEYLWGDHFFDPGTKQWSDKPVTDSGKKLKRGFCQFVLEPLRTLLDAVIAGDKDVYTKALDKIGVAVPREAREQEYVGKPLLKAILQAWQPASGALLEMIVNHLPSPKQAQRYRVEKLYSGPMDDACATAIRECDPNGPLMVYISKMVPTSDKGRFYAFGRVFAGVLHAGMDVRIQGLDYVPGTKTDLFRKKVQRAVLMMGRTVEALSECPCGNLVGLVGIDECLVKQATVTSAEFAHNFRAMKYSVAPVVRVTVDVCNAADLPKLTDGLRRLAKSDPLVQCITTRAGEHIVAAAGELHMEICLKDLREDFMKGAPIKVGLPSVSFCETVRAKTEMVCCSKSANRLNRIFMSAEPLDEDVVRAIDTGVLRADQEAKARASVLVNEFKWDAAEAKKIWSFGLPPDSVPNLLVDTTKSVQLLHEIRDSCCAAFQEASAQGVLCNERLRGVRFNLVDATLHSDPAHRGGSQIMQAVKRAVFACQLKSEPALLEPMYLAEISVPQSAVSGVYSTLSARRGVVESKEDCAGTPLCKISAFLPVLESFGFEQLLRSNTGGKAFPQLKFAKWQLVNGSVLDDGSQAFKICMDVRKRKGLKLQLPEFTEFHDKL